MTPWGQDVEPVRIGVIGCGSSSTNYLQAVRDCPVLGIIAYADIDQAAAERLGVDSVGVRGAGSA